MLGLFSLWQKVKAKKEEPVSNSLLLKSSPLPATNIFHWSQFYPSLSQCLNNKTELWSGKNMSVGLKHWSAVSLRCYANNTWNMLFILGWKRVVRVVWRDTKEEVMAEGGGGEWGGTPDLLVNKNRAAEKCLGGEGWVSSTVAWWKMVMWMARDFGLTQPEDWVGINVRVCVCVCVHVCPVCVCLWVCSLKRFRVTLADGRVWARASG